MASLPMMFGAAASGGVFAATAAKGGSKEEKSIIDWVLGKIAKQDQFYETDPLLQKTDDEGNGTTSKGTTGNGRKGTATVSGKKTSVSVQPKKKDGGNGGVFGGLFAKK